MKRLFLILLIACYTGISYSQLQEIQFSKIETKDGLSTSWVRCIYQDKYGFMWFATSNGLNRYDGYEMKVFQPDPSTEQGLINGSINYIAEKADGNLWICTDRGVSILDLEKQAFSSFHVLDRKYVNHVMKAVDGKFWFSTHEGLFVYDLIDKSMLKFVHDMNKPSSLSSDVVNSCFQDSKGRIWIASEGGLDLYMPEQAIFINYSRDNPDKQISGNIVSQLLEDSAGRLWVGLWDAGIDMLEENDTSLSLHFQVLEGGTLALLLDKNNRLWIGNGLGLGLQVIDLNDFSPEVPNYQRFEEIPDCEGSISDNTIICLFEDRSGGIWIGTYAGGVSYYHPKRKVFNSQHEFPGRIAELKNEKINCLLYAQDDFWIGTENGLYRKNRLSERLDHFYSGAEDGKSIDGSGILSLFKDSKNRLWVGTWSGGLSLYDDAQNSFSRVYLDPDDLSLKKNESIFFIEEDEQGNLWLGTNGQGLKVYQPETESLNTFLPDTSLPESISHDAMNDICILPDGRILISVYHVLEVYDPETEIFTHYSHIPEDPNSLGRGQIIDIFVDSRDNIWLGTATGLQLFDIESGSFKHYETKHGLADNTVNGIAEDAQGNLWISTNKGLSKFCKAVDLPEHPEFSHYQVSDGLTSNEFSRRSVCKLPDGWLYFGNAKGYSFFHPERISTNQEPPVMVLSDFTLFSENETLESAVFFGDINLVEKIELNYDMNDFVIEFAALNYLDPEKNSYKYILEGYENEWHEVGNRREATYTNIDPGRYVFKVMGTNNDGVWCVKEKSIEIIIKPPWWKTWIFRILLIISLIFLLYNFVMYRTRFLRKQKVILEEKVMERTGELYEKNNLLEDQREEISLQNEELGKHRHQLEELVAARTVALEEAIQRAEEADKLKSAFLANMSHEIRTPMNAIVGFAALMNTDDVEEDERSEFAQIIQSNCNTLMLLLNDILEVSLIEANQVEIKKENFSPDKVFDELEKFYSQNNTKNIQINYIRPENGERLIIENDATRFRQIFNNLISNACKYTEKGSVEFGYEQEDGVTRFFVKDTGIGISESEYQNIFNFFHKISKDDNQYYRGAGIGLSISNKLAEFMGGKIWLESTPGLGTTFFLSFDDIQYPPIEQENETNSKDRSVSKLDFSNKTIVLAEDEPANYELIDRILKRTRCRLIWKRNGQEVVDYFQEGNDFRDHVVIMDIKMPVMNGIKAAEELFAIDSTIPIIAVTAYAQEQDRKEILKQNFIDYVAKPIIPSDFLELISKYLD